MLCRASTPLVHALTVKRRDDNPISASTPPVHSLNPLYLFHVLVIVLNGEDVSLGRFSLCVREIVFVLLSVRFFFVLCMFFDLVGRDINFGIGFATIRPLITLSLRFARSVSCEHDFCDIVDARTVSVRSGRNFLVNTCLGARLGRVPVLSLPP